MVTTHRGSFLILALTLQALLFSLLGHAVSQPPCPASDNLDYVYDSNSQTCSIGDYKYAIQIKPGGVAIVGVPEANGNWTCAKITNSGMDTFFVPGGGANDGTKAGNNAKTDFIQYCKVDDSNGTGNLQTKDLLKCLKGVTCDLCAQDINGDILSSTPIDSRIQSFGLKDLCAQPSNTFSIPAVKNGAWSWTCGTAAGLSTNCTAPMASTPQNAQCGANVPAFNISSPPLDSVLCSAGTLTPSSLKNVGAQNTWSCYGVHGGLGATGCTAASLVVACNSPVPQNSAQCGTWALGYQYRTTNINSWNARWYYSDPTCKTLKVGDQCSHIGANVIESWKYGVYYWECVAGGSACAQASFPAAPIASSFCPTVGQAGGNPSCGTPFLDPHKGTWSCVSEGSPDGTEILLIPGTCDN